MKVFFTPYYSNNPYQKKIMEELRNIGISVEPAYTGANAFFKTKDIDKADVIHFHWFEAFIKASSFSKSLIKIFVFLIRLFFLKGNKKYVWTVHNLVNHEKKNVIIDKVFLFFFIKMIDVFFVHNDFSNKQILKKYTIDSDRIKIIPHGNYSNDYSGSDQSKNSFRTKIMGVAENKRTFTFLGHIRPYKGVLDLIKAFKNNANTNSQLLICGKVGSKEDLELIDKEIDNAENIIFKPGFVDDSEIESYLKFSDIMIYPYKDILTSGALILGMSMKKTCIASDVGSMSEFLDTSFLFNSLEELGLLINDLESKSSEELENFGKLNYSRIKEDTWSNMAFQLKKLYLN